MRAYIISIGLLFSLALPAQPVLAQDEYSELYAAYDAATPNSERHGNWHGMLGGAVIALQQPVADNRTVILPLVTLRYRDTFYWRFGQLGAYVWHSDDRRARLAVALKARRGYDPTDYPALAGMQQRRTSLEAGLQNSWLVRGSLVSYGIFTDISGHSNGSSMQLRYAHPIRLAPRWFLVPGLGAEWLSEQTVDYYYGVRPSETSANRSAYTGRASLNLRLGLMLGRRLSRDWLLFGGIGYTRLGSGISDSPIVVHDHITALHLGAGWMF